MPATRNHRSARRRRVQPQRYVQHQDGAITPRRPRRVLKVAGYLIPVLVVAGLGVALYQVMDERRIHDLTSRMHRLNPFSERRIEDLTKRMHRINPFAKRPSFWSRLAHTCGC